VLGGVVSWRGRSRCGGARRGGGSSKGRQRPRCFRPKEEEDSGGKVGRLGRAGHEASGPGWWARRLGPASRPRPGGVMSGPADMGRAEVADFLGVHIREGKAVFCKYAFSNGRRQSGRAPPTHGRLGRDSWKTSGPWLGRLAAGPIGPKVKENSFLNKNLIFEYTKAFEICRRRFRRNFDMRIFPKIFCAFLGFLE
jgi:hypothetical protein